MKITLFGGAFDPPHLGHIKVVANFLELKLVDEVWLLPVKNHAFAKTMASAEDRLAMLKLIKQAYFQNLPVKISEHELEQVGLSITFQTLKDLSKRWPEHQFSFLMGSDNLASFDQWHFYRELLAQFTVYVYPRAGFKFSSLRPGMVALENLEEMRVSSTVVKEKLLAGKAVSELLPPEIVHYLAKHGLYSG